MNAGPASPGSAMPVAAGVLKGAATDPSMTEALEAWRTRLVAAGVACRAVALHSELAGWRQDFTETEDKLRDAWVAQRSRVTADQPVTLAHVDSASGPGLLLAALLQLPTGQRGVLGVLLAPPHNDRTIQLVMLAQGWLQLSLSAASLAHNQRAGQLLELIGHVGSQSGARSAAQEWINRTAAWARAEVPSLQSGFTLALFMVERDQPRWWVAADVAWAETASPAVQEATEMATRAMVEMQELSAPPGWALPLMDEGEPVAVLVGRLDPGAGTVWPSDALTVLRASAGMAEPLLRHWRRGDRGLARHALDATRSGWRQLWGPGHLTAKLGACLAALALAALLVWPVPDRVTASTVIEGRTRQIVTAPFDGFIAQVLVRPGERVSKGQMLARLDDRELALEQGKRRSERDQAAGKLRQAMAERDAPAMALAQADVQQAEAQLALVEARLARAGLLSPIDGLVVTGDWVQQLGSPVETGKEMFEVATTDGYRVVLHVPDRDITRVRVGQPGALRLTGQPQTTYGFEVARVTATASVQDGVNGFRVEAAWKGQAPPLSPGMQGVGKVDVGRANLLTVWTRSSVDWLRLKLWAWGW